MLSVDSFVVAFGRDPHGFVHTADVYGFWNAVFYFAIVVQSQK